MSELFLAMQTLCQPQIICILILGCVIGIMFGAIPGLSGSGAIVLLMPLTYRMDSNLAIAFLIALWVGGCSGSFIASILIGIPGEAASIATVFDGHPMAKNGEAVRALSAGCVSNFIGTTPSVLVAMAACPLIAKAAISLGPWEYFGLGLCAITLIITLSKNNIWKGFISAGIGLMLTCVGLSPIDAFPRFAGNSYFLKGGFSLTYIMMGVFAASTILLEYGKGRHNESTDQKIGRFKWPKQDLIENRLNIIRSWLVGVWIGFLPGMGSALSNVTAYALAKNGSKHPEKFGKGTVEGVFAPEVANNASVGGAMIPMVALGIPGDTATAFLLGALTIHGIEPGPLMIINHGEFVKVMFLAVLLAAIVVFAVEIVGMPIYPKVLQIPKYYLYPAIIVICFLGAYSSENTLFAVLMVIIFSCLGVFMEYAGLPASPMILTFILGSMMESNLRKALSYADNGFLSFFTRPVSCIFMCIAIACVVWPMVKPLVLKKKRKRRFENE